MVTDAEDLIEAGYKARRRGDVAAANEIFGRALEMGRGVCASALIGRALEGRGQIERDLGRFGNALSLYEEAIGIFRGLGDRTRLVHALRHAADLGWKLGHAEAGLTFVMEAISILRKEGGSRLDLANALRVNALLIESSIGDAQEVWREARSLYEASGVSEGVVECESHLRETRLG